MALILLRDKANRKNLRGVNESKPRFDIVDKSWAANPHLLRQHTEQLN
jgi:hypothetical protein